MKRIFGTAIAVLCFAAPLCAQTGWVTVTASHLTAAGVNITNATATFCPVNASGNPLSFQVNGDGHSGRVCFSAPVTAGAVSVTLPDTNLTNPQNVCFLLTVRDKYGSLVLGGPGSGYTCLQPAQNTTVPNGWCASGACNLDIWTPNAAALVVQQTGPAGPQGPAGAAGPNAVTSATTTTFNAILKGNGVNVQAAGAGTDYATPASVTAETTRAQSAESTNAAAAAAAQTTANAALPANGITSTGGNLAVPGTATAQVFDRGGAVYNAKAYGAKGDERVTNPSIGSPAQAGCTVTSGSATVTCTDLTFTSADVGKLFHMLLAGPSSAEWVTTVSSVTDSSHAVMSGTASTTVSAGVWASVGTDDTSALNTTLTQAGLTCGTVVVSAGVYAYTPPLTIPTCVSIVGAGPNAINANRAPAGPEPDFNLWANTSPSGAVKSGTWLDAAGGTGLQLTNTMQVSLKDFGILNASYGIVCGSPTTLGCNWSTWRNLLVNGLQTKTGIASSQFSHAAYLIYATQHIYTDHIASYWTNTALHLVTWNGEGAAAFYSTANNTFKDTYGYAYAHTNGNGNAGEPCLWIENDDVTGNGGNEFIGQTQCNSYGSDSTATHLLIKGLTNPLVQQNFQQLDLEGGTGGCAITATRLTQSTLAHIGATTGNTTVCLDSTDSQNTFDGPNGITFSGDATGANRFNGLLQTAGAYGVYFDAADSNHINARVHQATVDNATILGAGGNTGKVVEGGTTALVVNNDNGTGGPMIQVGGGTGAAANKTVWDNYGEQTTTGNCGTMMSMDTNRGLKLANGNCMYFVGLGSAVASASTINPTAMAFHVTGTAAIGTIGVPTACSTSATSCTIRMIPDGAFTTTAAGNIAIASTAVVGKVLEMTYDATAAKWYPSY